MSPPLADLLPSLLAILVLALLVVFVMVQWSRAMIFRPDREERALAPTAPAAPATVRWGFAYLLSWAALICAFLWFFERLGPANPRNFLLLALVVAAWLGLNLVLIAFARAILRANRRDAAMAGERGFDPDEEVIAAKSLPSAAPARRRSWLREKLLLALGVIVALAIIGIGEALPPMQRLHSWVELHQRQILWITIPLLVVGFVLFMGGSIHLVLTRGTPMSRKEIDALTARTRMLAREPALWRGSVYRTRGIAVGSGAEEVFSIAEVKTAWHIRAWEVSPRWRRRFAVLIGVALFGTGLFATLFVFAPAGIQLLLAGAWIYAAVRTVNAFVRA
jgi:hypothetical protein